ncbi:hypothetical protein [Streptomyces sp. NPDC086519]|uniref:hypothetical protein n=1 Tax=Streptomyces sp. NPDC086519 TaxID=3154863 RepID=UPI0034490142
MPSLSTLTDNFNDGMIGPDWGNSYGGVTESGGKAHIPCTTSFAGYQTAYSWTMAGATFYVAVTSIPAASTATEAYIGVLVNAPDIDTSGNRIGFLIDSVTGLLRCKNDTSYSDPGSVDITYSPTTHKFLRLREDGSSVYWDTSPDGSTWTNRRTLATPAWVTSSTETCALDMSAHRDAGTADEATLDLFNTLSDGAVWDGAAALTADSSLAAGAVVSAHAAAPLTADTSITATPTVSMRATAVLAGESALMADASSSPIPEVAALAAGDFDLVIEQGSTFVQTYTVTDAGFTWDGWTARAQIRTAAAPDATLLLDLTPYLTILGPAVRLAIPATVTATLLQNGRWDLEMSMGTTVVRILKGKAIVDPEVTQ